MVTTESYLSELLDLQNTAGPGEVYITPNEANSLLSQIAKEKSSQPQADINFRAPTSSAGGPVVQSPDFEESPSQRGLITPDQMRGIQNIAREIPRFAGGALGFGAGLALTKNPAIAKHLGTVTSTALPALTTGIGSGIGTGVSGTIENIFGGQRNPALEGLLAGGTDAALTAGGGFLANKLFGKMPIGSEISKIAEQKVLNTPTDDILTTKVETGKEHALEAFKNKAKELYDQVNFKGETILPDDTLRAVQTIQKTIKADRTGKLASKLNKVLGNLEEGFQRPVGPDVLRATRSGINDALDDSLVAVTRKPTKSTKYLGQVKRGIESDIEKLANRVGPDVSSQLKGANKFYAENVDVYQGKLASRLQKAIDEAPEKMANTILKSPTLVKQIKQIAGPQGIDALGQQFERDLFNKSYKIADDGSEIFMPKTFLTNLKKQETVLRELYGKEAVNHYKVLAMEALRKGQAPPPVRNVMQALGFLGGQAVPVGKE